MSKDQDFTQFRRWLVRLVARSRWARLSKTDAHELAPSLGIQPDVLTEARALVGESSIETCAFVLDLPERAWPVWKRTCELQQLEGALLLRGLIQVLLSQGKLPKWTGRHWRLYGKRHALSGVKHGDSWPWQVKTSISRGADRALTEIAEHYKITKTALIRGQVIDYLEGRAPRVILIASDQMESDPRKYTRLWGLG